MQKSAVFYTVLFVLCRTFLVAADKDNGCLLTYSRLLDSIYKWI